MSVMNLMIEYGYCFPFPFHSGYRYPIPPWGCHYPIVHSPGLTFSTTF